MFQEYGGVLPNRPSTVLVVVSCCVARPLEIPPRRPLFVSQNAKDLELGAGTDSVPRPPLKSSGYVLGTQGEKEEAQILLQRAVKIRKNYLGPGHPDYARCLAKRAAALNAKVMTFLLMQDSPGRWCDVLA